jgi:hypothetical protein
MDGHTDVCEDEEKSKTMSKIYGPGQRGKEQKRKRKEKKGRTRKRKHR